MRGAAIAMVLALAGMIGASPALATERFDGRYQTVMQCPAFRDAAGVTFSFITSIRAGVLHGEHGQPDTAGYLVIDGLLQDDGTGAMSGHGLTGDPQMSVGHVAAFTMYPVRGTVIFTDAGGKGVRTNGRSCTFVFTKL